jgi:hypothetical protein
MRDIIILEKDWGCLDLSINSRKIDFLPRITLSDMTGAFILNVGFLAFTLNLVILDRNMRPANRRARQERRDGDKRY